MPGKPCGRTKSRKQQEGQRASKTPPPHPIHTPAKEAKKRVMAAKSSFLVQSCLCQPVVHRENSSRSIEVPALTLLPSSPLRYTESLISLLVNEPFSGKKDTDFFLSVRSSAKLRTSPKGRAKCWALVTVTGLGCYCSDSVLI